MKNSAIEWTDHTFNPWVGCAKVSNGCRNCYAETLMDKRLGRVEWGVNGTRESTSAANWKQPRKWNREAEAEGVRRRVFCASLADVFEDRHDTNSWRISLMELIELTHGLDWLLLTKRPENVVRLIQQATGRSVKDFFERNPHVWIGTSVENQETADERLLHLVGIPTRVRFLSIEPLLGPVDLTAIPILNGRLTYNFLTGLSPIDPKTGMPEAGGPCLQWVIVGGESGPEARPMNSDWARSIRDQCLEAGVPFFFKQWGEWWPHDQGRWVTDAETHVSHDLFDDFYKIGKHAAGHMLDGREWQEFPNSSPAPTSGPAKSTPSVSSPPN